MLVFNGAPAGVPAKVTACQPGFRYRRLILDGGFPGLRTGSGNTLRENRP